MANEVEIIVTAEDRASGVLSGIGGSLGNVGRIATGAALGGIGLVAGGMALAGSAAIDMNAKLETSTLQFETLMGDSDRAREHVEGLFDFAANTPFETGPIIEASRLMQVFGGDALNTEENLTRIGDTAAAVGAPIEDIGFWVGRAYAAIEGGQPFGEAAQNLMQMGAVSPDVVAEMNRLKEAGASSDEIFAVLQGHMDGFTGAMEKQAGTWEGLKSTIIDNLNMAAATALKPFFEMAKEGLAGFASWLSSPAIQQGLATIAEKIGVVVQAIADFVSGILSGEDPVGDFANLFWTLADVFGATEEQALKIFEAVRTLGDQIVAFVAPIIEAVTNFVSFKDVLIALGIAILSAVIPAVVSLVLSMAPILIAVGAVIAVVALLRNAWESDFGGIQEKTRAAWAAIQPILQIVWTWLKDTLTAALETLRQVWVDHVWPAIQTAIEIAWPIISAIFQALVDFVEVVIIPILQALYRVWVEEVWPAIQTAIGAAWDFIKPIWEAIRVWLTETLPPAIRGLRTTFEGAMNGIRSVVQTVKGIWDGFVGAVQAFWNWLTNRSFDLNFKMPDWLVPGTPGGKSIDLGGKALGSTTTAAGGGGKTTIVNIDARGASSGAAQDIRRVVEQVMREYGTRADVRLRTV